MANEEKKPVAPQTKGAAVKRTDKKLGFFKRVAKWFREMKSELKKVVWPTKSQMLNNTLIVLACVLVVGIFIVIFDQVGELVVQGLFKLAQMLKG